MARRTVRAEGLTRFIAVCLLAGYAWLLVGGGLAIYFGNTGAGFVYDATLHAVFVGFVFSMIFGHAPVIFPSVLDISIPYRPVFYVPVVLLHGALLLRVVGDLALIESLRLWGAWGNAAAILFFLVATVSSTLWSGGTSMRQPASVESKVDLRTPAEASPESDVSGEEVPDLERPSTE